MVLNVYLNYNCDDILTAVRWANVLAHVFGTNAVLALMLWIFVKNKRMPRKMRTESWERRASFDNVQIHRYAVKYHQNLNHCTARLSFGSKIAPYHSLAMCAVHPEHMLYWYIDFLYRIYCMDFRWTSDQLVRLYLALEPFLCHLIYQFDVRIL